MLSPPQISHLSVFSEEESATSYSSYSSSANFAYWICSIFGEIRSFTQHFRIINLISSIICQIQFICLGFCANSNPEWMGTTRFRYFTHIISFFVRIIPFDSGVETHFYTCIALFFIHIILMFQLLLIYFTYKPANAYTSSAVGWTPAVTFNVYRVLFFPSCSLFFASNFMTNYSEGTKALILSIFSVIIATVGYFFEETLRTCYPTLGDFFDNSWNPPPTKIYVIFKIISICLCEMAPQIGNINGRFAMLIIFSVLTLAFSISIILVLPLTIQSSNVYISSTYAFAFIESFLSAFGMKYHWDVGLLFSIQIFSLPFVFYFIKFLMRIRYEAFLRVADKCFEEKDFSILKKYNISTEIHIACLSFRKDWSIFEYLLESTHNNFNVLIVYAKFVIFYPDEIDRLKNIINLLFTSCRLSLTDLIAATYFEMIYVQSGPTLKNDTALTSSCQVVDDYLLSLHLFWTEILLGRSNRLMSLSNSVNQKYNACRAFFDHLGLASIPLKHYTRFRSISALQFAKLNHHKNYGILKTVMEDSAKVITSIDLNNPPPTLDDSDTVVMRNLNIQQAALEMHKKLLIFRHLIIYIPFYAALITSVLIAFSFFFHIDQVRNVWDFLRKVCDTTYPLYTPYMTETVIALQELGIVSKETFSYNIKNNQWFPSYLEDPKSDSIGLLMKALSESQKVYRLSEQLAYFCEIDFLFRTYPIYFFISENNETKELMFSSYVNAYTVRALDRLDNFDDANYIFEFYGSNISHISSKNMLGPLSHIISFFKDYPDIVSDYFTFEFSRKIFAYETTATILLVVSFILQTISTVLLYNLYNDFFMTLFVLPKITISQLIDKLGSRISAKFSSKDDYGNNVKYNLTQLSYQEAPQSFTTSKRAFIFSIFFYLLVTIAFRLLYLPCTFLQKNYISKVLNNLNMASPELRIPFYLIVIAHHTFELIFIDKMGITPPNNYREELINSHMNLTSILYNDFLIYISDTTYLPPIHNANVFINTNECDVISKSPITCRSIAVSSLFFASQMFHFNSLVKEKKTIDDKTIETIIGSIFGIFCHMVPIVNNDLFMQFDNLYISYMTGIIVIFLAYLLILFLYLELARQVFRRQLNDPDFTLSFLTSIPVQVLANFSLMSKYNSGSETGESSGEIIMAMFENENVIQYIVEMIILCDSENKIILSTPNAQSKLMVEDGTNMNDFLTKLSGFQPKIELPPDKPDEIHIDVRNSEIPPMFLKTTFTPIKKTEVNGRQVSYAVTMVDVSQRENLIIQLNIEANKVRMLATQLVPWRVAERLLNGVVVQPIILPKIISACFILKASDPLIQSDILMIQNSLRELMNQCDFLSFFGRSLQIFRIISGISSPNMPMIDQGVQSIHFSLNLIEIIGNISKAIGKNIDVHCGMHLSGPFYADAIETSPPVYDAFGFSMTICESIALKGVPNKVNITRDVYELVFKQGFIITFENEIEVNNGTLMPIHMVQRQ
ncbi:hypothetical protein TRFO_24417 [Tritrichomonas foetus]|uniref:Guanylate cyclase domain-containing protein n=1 Tax=Tritrichomonas foetus TaxID=1144522 RepID=A0A1J4K7E1_9EUKA|nr:hypothetical protein TRFO_24417 [Tritrichomonas foetus]|eukprot:OHT07401.1 hypothetical protein TRFO_24417 [Tritrichomonas foetus]